MTIMIKREMEDTKVLNRKLIILYIVLFLTSALIVLGGYLLYGLSAVAAIRLACFIIFGQLIVIFSCRAGVYYNSFFSINANNTTSFYISYIIALVLSAIFPLMPVSAWPVVVIFAALTVTSNIPTGIISSCVCLVIASSLGDTVYFAYFVIYFLTGIMASLLIAHIDEEFRIGFPILIIEVVLTASLIIVAVTSGAQFSFELFIYPYVNAAITLLLLLIVLKLYAANVLFARKDAYLDLNDPECKLLSELRNSSPDDYFKTVHVVYFCDRIAKTLMLDENIIKCAGLYHRVGVIGGENSWENTSMICTEQGIPNEVMVVLREFIDKSIPITKTETVVLYMSECVVNSIQYLFKKNKDITPDYPALIEAIFKQRIDTGIFKQSDITIKQFELMKHIFIEEKLYYDFLR